MYGEDHIPALVGAAFFLAIVLIAALVEWIRTRSLESALDWGGPTWGIAAFCVLYLLSYACAP